MMWAVALMIPLIWLGFCWAVIHEVEAKARVRVAELELEREKVKHGYHAPIR